jgi:hypothetical protein
VAPVKSFLPDPFQRTLINDDDEEERDDREDEQPTIVVLKDGDLVSMLYNFLRP